MIRSMLSNSIRVYGVGGKLLKAVQSFYVGNDVSE